MSLIPSAINLSYLSWKRNVSSCRLHCGLFYYFYPVYYSLPFSYLWVKLRSVEFCVRSLLKTKLFCVPHKWDPVHGVCKERKKKEWNLCRSLTYDKAEKPHCIRLWLRYQRTFSPSLSLFICSHHRQRSISHALVARRMCSRSLVHTAGFALKISCHTVAWII